MQKLSPPKMQSTPASRNLLGIVGGPFLAPFARGGCRQRSRRRSSHPHHVRWALSRQHACRGSGKDPCTLVREHISLASSTPLKSQGFVSGYHFSDTGSISKSEALQGPRPTDNR